MLFQKEAEQLDHLVTVLDLVRSGTATTKPELGRVTGLGRTAITQRVAQLINAGLVDNGDFGRSTGGRAPRELRFRQEVGHVLAAELGATSINVALTDLAGRLLHRRERPNDIATGPEASLAQVDELFDQVLAEAPGTTIWGVGVGVPGPVEFAIGRPISPPIMPGWDGYPIRDRYMARFGVPVWVDNDVNVMALGELRRGLAHGEDNVVYIKIGTGIGAGLVSGGRLHRGTQGCAGDVGHVAIVDDPTVVCRCGKIGCLEALAGGAALAKEAMTAAQENRSPYLRRRLDAGQSITAADVAAAAARGDPVSVALLTRAGRLVGEVLATIVNFYNPSLIIIGGQVAGAGDLLLASIRQVIYQRSLPLATRDLRIVRSRLHNDAGLTGAAWMVIDELFSRRYLEQWLGAGSPIGRFYIEDYSEAGNFLTPQFIPTDSPATVKS